MSICKVGELNPMYNKEKSKAFLANMQRVQLILGLVQLTQKVEKRFTFMIVTGSLLNVMIVLDLL